MDIGNLIESILIILGLRNKHINSQVSHWARMQDFILFEWWNMSFWWQHRLFYHLENFSIFQWTQTFSTSKARIQDVVFCNEKLNLWLLCHIPASRSWTAQKSACNRFERFGSDRSGFEKQWTENQHFSSQFPVKDKMKGSWWNSLASPKCSFSYMPKSDSCFDLLSLLMKRSNHLDAYCISISEGWCLWCSHCHSLLGCNIFDIPLLKFPYIFSWRKLDEISPKCGSSVYWSFFVRPDDSVPCWLSVS